MDLKGAGAPLLLAALISVPGVAHAAACPSAGGHDFDGDGKDDIAAGAPQSTVGGDVAAGSVIVMYGQGRQVTVTAPEPQQGAGFGWSMTTAHVNSDRCLDLVVGAPWQDDGGRTDAGAAYVFYGSPDGLGKPMALTGASAQAGAMFGFSLGAHDAHGDDDAGIVVGAPYENWRTFHAAGAVHIVWINASGSVARTTNWTQGDDGDRVPGRAEDGDLFGYAVTLGSVGGDPRRTDLIVTEPREDVDGEGTDVGSMSVVYDIGGTAPSPGFEHWHYLNLPGLSRLGTVSGAQIGYSVAYAESGTTSYVAVGAPGQTIDGKRRAGAVQVLSSTGSGLQVRDTITDRPAGTGDGFGTSVAVSGPQLTRTPGVTLAAGAPYADDDRGRALMIKLGAAKGTWTAGNAPGDRYAWSLALTGQTLLAGTPGARTGINGALTRQPLTGAPPQQIHPTTTAFFGASTS